MSTHTKCPFFHVPAFGQYGIANACDVKNIVSAKATPVSSVFIGGLLISLVQQSAKSIAKAVPSVTHLGITSPLWVKVKNPNHR
jgi:hypothetical protein